MDVQKLPRVSAVVVLFMAAVLAAFASASALVVSVFENTEEMLSTLWLSTNRLLKTASASEGVSS